MSLNYLDLMGYNPHAISAIEEAHKDLRDQFAETDSLVEYNQAKILKAFIDLKISTRHFAPTTGYGYGDEGRDALDSLYSKIFGSEDALVRTQWVSGTHVISDSLFALLRPGDCLLSVTGKPYDTLTDVIEGSGNNSYGSLKDWGIKYKEIPMLGGGEINMIEVKNCLGKQKVKLALIQRSRGYNWRQSLNVDYIRKIIMEIKVISPDTMILVDNCYGEFTEMYEPPAFGADLTVGSLIKNPGGGIAPTGAYAAGTSKAIELLSFRLTSPGLGREVGSFPHSYANIYQGLFMAPHIVGQALKGAALAGLVFKRLGYKVEPVSGNIRSDIIQSIRFNSAEELITFCQAIQASSPVDGYVTPYPWEMPGYDHQVIMAAGTFVQGSSIELSADAPIKEPYIAYLQGGLTYEHVKLALMNVLTLMIKKGFVKL